MKSFAVFAKGLAVLFLSRRYFQSVDLGEYLAGFRHLVGIRIRFSVPRYIYFKPINQLNDAWNQSADDVNLPASSVSLAYSQSCPKYFHPEDEENGLFAFENAVITKQYGIHDLCGRPVLGSTLVRGNLENASSYPNGYPRSIGLRGKAGASRRLQEIPRAFYVTYMFLNHIGHELTEVISAIHPLLAWRQQGEDFSRIPIIVHRQFAKYTGILSNILGLDQGDILVPGLNCDELLVKTAYFASPSFVLKNFVSPKHHLYVKSYFQLVYGDQFSQMLAMRSTRKNKVYISRSRIGFRQRQFLEEKDLERRLEALGWMIYHPQEYSRQEQLKVYQLASFLCSLEGSALHFLLGINTECLRKVVLLAESKVNDFVLQFDSQDVPCMVLSCLEKDTYPPLVRNNVNVRLRAGLDVFSLAHSIESLVSADFIP